MSKRNQRPLSRGVLGALVAVLVFAVSGAYGESFNQRVKKANRQLIDGDADGALSSFRDLQTDEPESPLLYYGQGCALYKQGVQESDAPSPEHAVEAFKAARESFEKASLSPDEKIRLSALYNRATSTSELATLLTKAKDTKGAVDAFKDAIAQYEDLLKRRPDDAASKKNLDHIRYLLKKFLQNPPKQQDQKDQSGQGKDDKDKKDSDKKQDQEQSGGGQDSKGEKKDQQGQQGQDQDKKDQQQSQQQDGDNKNDSDKDGKKNDQTTEQQKQQQLADAKKNENQPQPEGQKSGQPGDQKSDKQTIDAILDSLEAQDNREQKDMRNPTGNIAMRRDWW
jgi:Ca-activated chloride channel family protein